jgi:molybdenum cofactor guanylyltransferase
LAEESSKLEIIMKTMFEGFILVGGKSSRMGKDKFLLKINGKTFLQTAFETLKKVEIEKISVSVSENISLIKDFPVVEDIFKNRGALSGIQSALVHSKSSFTIILACDYPFVSVELIEFLMNVATIENEFDAYAPIQIDGKIQPLCAVYKTETCGKSLSKMLENEAGNYSVRDFLNRVKTRYIKFNEIEHLPNAETFFFNVNTPEDFSSAEKLNENYTEKNAG